MQKFFQWTLTVLIVLFIGFLGYWTWYDVVEVVHADEALLGKNRFGYVVKKKKLVKDRDPETTNKKLKQEKVKKSVPKEIYEAGMARDETFRRVKSRYVIDSTKNPTYFLIYELDRIIQNRQKMRDATGHTGESLLIHRMDRVVYYDGKLNELWSDTRFIEFEGKNNPVDSGKIARGGERILIRNSGPGLPGFRVYSKEGEVLYEWENQRHSTDADITSDGQYIAYRREIERKNGGPPYRGKIYVRNLDTGEEREVFPENRDIEEFQTARCRMLGIGEFHELKNRKGIFVEYFYRCGEKSNNINEEIEGI